METNSEEKKLSEDEEIEVNEKFESIVQESINKIAYSMGQLFSIHDIIMGGKRSISSEKYVLSTEIFDILKYVLSTEMFDILEKIQTYNFSDNQKEFLRGIVKQEQAMINLLDDEYKKIV